MGRLLSICRGLFRSYMLCLSYIGIPTDLVLHPIEGKDYELRIAVPGVAVTITAVVL